MDDILFYGTFVLASIWVALEPGPGFIKLSMKTAGGGKLAGFTTATGMFVGAIPFIFLIAFGLGWIVDAAPNMLGLLKIAGGLYLLWMAYDLLHTRKLVSVENANHDRAPKNRSSTKEGFRCFFGGMILVLLNPRTFLFYSAFLPLFTRGDMGFDTSTQMIFLGISVCFIFLTIDFVFVACISRYGAKIRESSLVSAISRYVGVTVLSFFGLKLLLNSD